MAHDERRKDVTWAMPAVMTWETVQTAILMDIRDELKRMNNVLACPKFQRIPTYLRAMAARRRKAAARKIGRVARKR